MARSEAECTLPAPPRPEMNLCEEEVEVDNEEGGMNKGFEVAGWEEEEGWM